MEKQDRQNNLLPWQYFKNKFEGGIQFASMASETGFIHNKVLNQGKSMREANSDPWC